MSIINVNYVQWKLFSSLFLHKMVLNLQNTTEHSVCEQLLLQQGIFNNDTLITVGFN